MTAFKYDMNYHREKFGNWIDNKRIYDLRKEYAKRNYFYMAEETDKVFEFGCGVGQNIAWSKNAYGYDINKELYPLLKSKGIKTFNEIKDIPNDYFDIIFTCLVLEHLPNPLEILQMLKTKLKSDGLLINVFPIVYYNREYELNETIDGHIYAWGFYEGNYMLNYCGFENIINKKLYRKGIERFKSFPNSLYFWLLNLFGRITNEFDIMIISKKEEDKHEIINAMNKQNEGIVINEGWLK